eukprot:9496612-Pyramimonas_sp.AAC.1
MRPTRIQVMGDMFLFHVNWEHSAGLGIRGEHTARKSSAKRVRDDSSKVKESKPRVSKQRENRNDCFELPGSCAPGLPVSSSRLATRAESAFRGRQRKQPTFNRSARCNTVSRS